MITQILAKRQKALVIYGTQHLGEAPDSLRSIVENTYPGAFFVITPYSGYHEAACAARRMSALGSTPTTRAVLIAAASWRVRPTTPCLVAL